MEYVWSYQATGKAMGSCDTSFVASPPATATTMPAHLLFHFLFDQRRRDGCDDLPIVLIHPSLLIPPLNSIISALNAIPSSDPVMDSEHLAMLLTLLDTIHSASTASSRNVCLIADLTDAEFEELKSISVAQNLVFDDIMDR